jgi:hypothetical protein
MVSTCVTPGSGDAGRGAAATGAPGAVSQTRAATRATARPATAGRERDDRFSLFMLHSFPLTNNGRQDAQDFQDLQDMWEKL